MSSLTISFDGELGTITSFLCRFRFNVLHFKDINKKIEDLFIEFS